METTREPMTEVETSTGSPAITGSRADYLFVLSAMLGAAVGAVVGVLLAPNLSGGENAEMFGALGAMLGSWAFAAAACLLQREAAPVARSESIATPTEHRLAG